jgi:ethanolamine utilization protein EutM
VLTGALGLLETRGRSTAVEALDGMLKAALVHFLGLVKIGGARNTVMITGEVSAVEAAIEAGAAICRERGTLIASLVIPRPHEDLEKLLPKRGEETVRGKGPGGCRPMGPIKREKGGAGSSLTP